MYVEWQQGSGMVLCYRGVGVNEFEYGVVWLGLVGAWIRRALWFCSVSLGLGWAGRGWAGCC